MFFLNLYVLEKFVYFFKCDNVKVINGRKRPDSKSRVILNPGDVLNIKCGGGGFYSPQERDPEKVLNDYLNGLVSLKSAYQIYKVPINRNKKEIDWEKTKILRK